MERRITIKDIARELNIHHSTVSRALHNDQRVKMETQKRVLEFAAKHGYRINMNALHLRGNTNNSIALIVPNIRHYFFTNIISHITSLAFKKGFVISIFESNEKTEQEQEIINSIISYNFAGVIASIAKNTMNSEHFGLLRKYNIPLVFFDRVCEDLETPKVMVNNYDSAFQATEILIKKGYQRIANITGPIHLNVFRDRQRGYIDALSTYKQGYQDHLIINKEFTIEDGKKGLLRLLDQTEKPDAILSSSSLLSIGILIKAKELGFNVPEDLALISFGDNQLSNLLEPGITSIIQPEEEIAESCIDLIFKLIKKEYDQNYPIVKNVETKIIYRQSM